MKRLLKILLLFMIVSCDASMAIEPVAGFVYHEPGRTYIYTTAPRISSQENVYIQYLNADGITRCCKQVQGGLLSSPEPTGEPVSDEFGAQQVFRYSIPDNLVQLSAKPFLGIAAIGGKAKEIPATQGAGVSISSAPSVNASTCLSREGVHLFVESDDKRRAHLYYSLGYSVDATCDPGLFQVQ